MGNRFSDEELVIAKSVDLTEVARRFGYSVAKIGRHHTLKEMDSIRIHNRKNWFRWSNNTGGSQIDFLCEICDMEIKDAITWLLDFAGYKRSEDGSGRQELKNQVKEIPQEKVAFTLPIAANDNNRVYKYLNEERRINTAVIDYFVNRGLVYESRQYHNVVFVSKDKKGNAKHAHIKAIHNKSIKYDVTGSDKNYGFNITNENSTQLKVFEGAIDLLSYVEIFTDYETNKLALGMLWDAPLTTFLNENPQINTIDLCLDDDEPGREAARRLYEKYGGLGYQVSDSPPPMGYKDYNDWLKATMLEPFMGAR